MNMSPEVRASLFKKLEELFENEQFILILREPENDGAHLFSNSPMPLVCAVMEKLVSDMKDRES